MDSPGLRTHDHPYDTLSTDNFGPDWLTKGYLIAWTDRDSIPNTPDTIPSPVQFDTAPPSGATNNLRNVFSIGLGVLTKASVYHETPLISLGHIPGLVVFRCKNFSPWHLVFSFFFFRSLRQTLPSGWPSPAPRRKMGNQRRKKVPGFVGSNTGPHGWKSM